MISVGIIESDYRFRNDLLGVLKLANGISVIGIWEDAEAAIRYIPRFLPDVVLVDLALPGISGVECIRKLKARNNSLMLMVLTDQQDSESVFAALKAGASGYLLKTDGPEAILKGVRELSLGGAPMNLKIAKKVITYFSGASENSDIPLTRREIDVIRLLAAGKIYKEVASELDISIATTKKHINNIYSKLEVQNRTEAINKWQLIWRK